MIKDKTSVFKMANINSIEHIGTISCFNFPRKAKSFPWNPIKKAENLSWYTRVNPYLYMNGINPI